ncbi:hypothetical protein Pint_18782 [Pistacia integerrima]|uniref:Uncharacterized protein n=1 Tax=Pistacia integerrima TaxID=434235 RepID=A0ACC0YZ90_9ROSI|nr:hypothetical protein Pint_18782 [Pistacia integerrima]
MDQRQLYFFPYFLFLHIHPIMPIQQFCLHVFQPLVQVLQLVPVVKSTMIRSLKFLIHPPIRFILLFHMQMPSFEKHIVMSSINVFPPPPYQIMLIDHLMSFTYNILKIWQQRIPLDSNFLQLH